MWVWICFHWAKTCNENDSTIEPITNYLMKWYKLCMYHWPWESHQMRTGAIWANPSWQTGMLLCLVFYRFTRKQDIQYIPRNMHTFFALLCFVVVIHWLIFPYPSGLLHWHCGNLTIAPEPAKQPWWIWTNTSCEFIMNDCITTTKQSTTKPCAYFLGYTVCICTQ